MNTKRFKAFPLIATALTLLTAGAASAHFQGCFTESSAGQVYTTYNCSGSAASGCLGAGGAVGGGNCYQTRRPSGTVCTTCAYCPCTACTQGNVTVLGAELDGNCLVGAGSFCACQLPIGGTWNAGWLTTAPNCTAINDCTG